MRVFFKCAPNFFLGLMEVQRDERCGRILLGDIRGHGAVMLLPIVFQCVEGDFSWTRGYMHRPV